MCPIRCSVCSVRPPNKGAKMWWLFMQKAINRGLNMRSKQGYYFHTFNLARRQHFSQIENRPSMFFAQPFLCWQCTNTNRRIITERASLLKVIFILKPLNKASSGPVYVFSISYYYDLTGRHRDRTCSGSTAAIREVARHPSKDGFFFLPHCSHYTVHYVLASSKAVKAKGCTLPT